MMTKIDEYLLKFDSSDLKTLREEDYKLNKNMKIMWCYFVVKMVIANLYF